MGDRATIRAHSFRFARLVQTRLLLASRKSLATAPSRGSAQSPSGAEAALRVEELVRMLQAERPEQSGGVAVLPVDPGAKAQPVSVQELIAAGALRYIKGNRLEDADLAPGGGTRVLGPAELLDPHTAPPRHLSLMDFAANNPSGRLTEPGDVVFCTSPRPAALVDMEGGAAVVFPARVLRIDAGDPAVWFPTSSPPTSTSSRPRTRPGASGACAEPRTASARNSVKRSAGCNTNSNKPANASSGSKNSLP
jgi:hypothetical protein